MAAKTVALDTEAYRLLQERKRPNETFSDVVKRIARPRRALTDFIGIWAGDSVADWERFDSIRQELREGDLQRMAARPRRHVDK